MGVSGNSQKPLHRERRGVAMLTQAIDADGSQEIIVFPAEGAFGISEGMGVRIDSHGAGFSLFFSTIVNVFEMVHPTLPIPA